MINDNKEWSHNFEIIRGKQFFYKLYDILNSTIFITPNFYEDVDKILKNKLNMQNNVKKLKLGRDKYV